MLFIDELDGPTFATLDDALSYAYDLAHQDYDGVWSNYGGWVN